MGAAGDSARERDAISTVACSNVLLEGRWPKASPNLFYPLRMLNMGWNGGCIAYDSEIIVTGARVKMCWRAETADATDDRAPESGAVFVVR